MRKAFQACGKTVKLVFIVFLVFLGTLFFRSQRIPRCLVTRVTNALSSSNAVVHCESAAFGFRHGLELGAFRVFDPTRRCPLEPVLAADAAVISFFARSVTVSGLRIPRLGDAYYGYSTADMGGAGVLKLPRLPEFRLELVSPSILGVEPARVIAAVDVSPTGAKVADIVLRWPEADGSMRMTGECAIDLVGRRVKGSVAGAARQRYIRPLLETLDVGIALPYFDAFTGVAGPVPAACAWNVDLDTLDFSLDLDLHPVLGAYNAVPLKRVDGAIGIKVGFEHGKSYATTIGPLAAVDRRGGALTGSVVFTGTNGVDRIRFDAKSTLALKDTLDVIGYLNDGVLDCLECPEPPEVSVTGVLYPDVALQSGNDLGGRIAFGEGRLFGIPLRDAVCSYAYRGSEITFDDAVAKGLKGGDISGAARLKVPGLVASNAEFSVDFHYRNGQFGELQGIAGIDFGERRGRLEGDLSLSGPMDGEIVPRLNGSGRIAVTEGHIARMNLFLGLTELLVEHVPGVSAIVDQSDASADFVIENGVIRSDNIVIQGALFSILAKGSYDMAKDALDFTVQVRFLKDENLLGKYLIRPILWPFTKLLLEFRVKGGVKQPDWEYISILDRVL